MVANENDIDRKRSRPVTKKKKSDYFKKNKALTIFIVLIIAIIAIAGIVAFLIDFGEESEGNPVAIINTSMGTIKVELYKDKAPNTVDNFISYANEGFYDGLVFHRVMDDFMIQGGGFYPDGTKKETKAAIDLEIHEDLKHVDGAIAMARTSEPNTATSQFFINDGAQPNLEPGGVDIYGYTVFGGVIEGMDVVRAIASVDTELKYVSHGNWPKVDVMINSIVIEE